MIIIRSKAPFRISYGGGGADMTPYCIENGSCFISTGIDRYVYITIIPWTDELIRVSSQHVMLEISMKKIIESKNLTILNDFGILIGKNYKLNEGTNCSKNGPC